MPVLHEISAELGYIGAEDQAVVADVLNLSRAEVFGVVSFYDDFRTEPAPEHTVRICRGEACQSVGAEELFDAVSPLGARPGVEVSEVFCLGNCALGPSAMIDGTLLGRTTQAAVEVRAQGWSA